MNDNQKDETPRILLSREELLFVLQQLEATTIPGLDNDPRGDFTPEGRALALVVAEHSLRARGLARLDPTAADANAHTVRTHQMLLRMVGACAYSQRAILLYHRSAQSDTPVRYFGHIRGKDIIAHTHPEADLHLFTMLSSREQLFSEILTRCACPATLPVVHEFTLPFSVFALMQQAIDEGHQETAQQLLANANVTPSNITPFLTLATKNYHLSVLLTLKQQPDNSIVQREFLLLQNTDVAWLAFAAKQPSGQIEMRIKTTNRAELQQLWSEWL